MDRHCLYSNSATGLLLCAAYQQHAGNRVYFAATHHRENGLAKAAYCERVCVYRGDRAFPETSGYIEGSEPLASQGLASLTINNSSNTSDLYGKLYALKGDLTALVRTFLVAAENSFIISNLDAGCYELRYQDLETGGLAKTKPLSLKRIETD